MTANLPPPDPPLIPNPRPVRERLAWHREQARLLVRQLRVSEDCVRVRPAPSSADGKGAAMAANADALPISQTSSQPARRKPAVRTKEAAALIGVGLATFERLDAAGKGPAGITLGGSKLWSVRELRAWVDAGMPSRYEWAPLWKAIRESKGRR